MGFGEDRVGRVGEVHDVCAVSWERGGLLGGRGALLGGKGGRRLLHCLLRERWAARWERAALLGGRRGRRLLYCLLRERWTTRWERASKITKTS